MCQEDAQHFQKMFMMYEANILRKYANARAGKATGHTDHNGQRAVHEACQDDEETDVATWVFDVLGSKPLNFHSVRSVLIAKLKMQSENRNMWI